MVCLAARQPAAPLAAEAVAANPQQAEFEGDSSWQLTEEEWGEVSGEIARSGY